MKKLATILGALSLSTLSACTPSEGARGDSNLTCAAIISGATYLGLKGTIEIDRAFTKRALSASMTYLNSYAIPKGLKEPQAFEELNALRASLMEELEPAELMARAKRCVERSPI